MRTKRVSTSRHAAELIPEWVATMWLYGQEYSQQRLGIREYFRSLPLERKRLIEQFCEEMRDSIAAHP